MTAISAYLATVFDAYPQSPRLLDARAELEAMMEDAYEDLIADGATADEAAGQVITEFGDLDELTPALGAPARQTRSHGRTEVPSGGDTHVALFPPVTITEAAGFAEVARRTRFHLAGSVAVFVASPIPLVLLIAGADTRASAVSVEAAIAIGLVVLLLCVTAGVLLLVRRSARLSPYARLGDGRFAQNPAVHQWADTLRRNHEHQRTVSLMIAVLLWVLSPIPLLLAALAEPTPGQDLWIAAGAAFTLLAASIGLLIQLAPTWARSVAEVLTRARRQTR